MVNPKRNMDKGDKFTLIIKRIINPASKGGHWLLLVLAIDEKLLNIKHQLQASPGDQPCGCMPLECAKSQL